jgi:outer membrane protein OmpA-like peptidoglycan-associated protein
MKRFVFPLFIFLPVLIAAQTAVEMELILSVPEVSFAQASRFVLTIADVVDEAADGGAAYTLARDRGWLPRNVSPASSIKLGELCFLIMNAFNMRGSFLYAILPGPHYAFRELNYLKLIPGQSDPSVKVSGERFLQILGMVASYAGVDRKAPEAAPPVEVTVVEAPEEELAEEPAIERIGVVRLADIRFGLNSAELTETEKAKLRGMSGILARYPNAKVLAGGHAVMVGSEAGRRRISVERARAVADYMVSLKACREEDVIVRGYAARWPLGDNATEEGKAINRRVEITLLNEGYYTIQFMPNSVRLPETEKVKLRELAAALSRYPDIDLSVKGHTAMAGDNNGRLSVSTERARVVANFLRTLGFRHPRTITIRGYGDQIPLENNATEEGQAINRRVEITLQDREVQ